MSLFVFLLILAVGAIFITVKVITAFIKYIISNKADYPKKTLISCIPLALVLCFYAFTVSYKSDELLRSFEKISPPEYITTSAPETLTIDSKAYKKQFSSDYEYYGQYGDVIVLKTNVKSITKDYENTQACCLVDKSGRLLTRGNEYYAFIGVSTAYSFEGEPVIACEHRLTSIKGGSVIGEGERAYYSIHGKELKDSELDRVTITPTSDKNDVWNEQRPGIHGIIMRPTGDMICIKNADEYDYYIEEG
ncbi:MAG: hypothetical protein J6O40_05585 [Ruminococcus sp.]|nr:hypothetical protein [Ruminococcus sp.]